MKLKGYKLCQQCGQPILKKGQKRKHPNDYRHAYGCPNQSPTEKRYENLLWERINKRRPNP